MDFFDVRKVQALYEKSFFDGNSFLSKKYFTSYSPFLPFYSHLLRIWFNGN